MDKSIGELNVICPANNHSEREYIIKLFFEDFLGLKCTIRFENDALDYVVKFGSQQIIFEDHFFKHFPKNLSYLTKDNIPECYSKLTSRDLPIIFGRDFLDIKENEIQCGFDIFASSFFLLTRWEEFVLPSRADSLRCDENQLFVVKNGLTHRPLVNEYLGLLSEFFEHFELVVKPQRKFAIFQTHDVDWVHLSTFSELIQNMWKMITRQKLYKRSWLIFWRYFYYRLTFTNPFNSFNDFMDFSEANHLNNVFYFKACTKDEIGFTYNYKDSRVKKIVSNILQRGHNIGFHPSENTYKNEMQFKLEYERLEKIAPVIEGGRQHHLLYHADSFKIWNKYELGYDSGYGFQFRNGFRCGICFEFPVFDVLVRQKLNLEEIPFVIMDSAFARKKSSPAEMERESKELIDIVKKFNGILCTVWHTNMFKTLERKKYVKTYFKIIKYAINGEGK
jgi:hypothetical protein